MLTEQQVNAQLDSDEQKEEEQALARTDLKYLCRDLLGMGDWDICHDQLLEWRYQNRDRRFKMVLMPRGHLKSSILTVGESIQDILKNFDESILISSSTNELSKSFLHEIKEYLTIKSTLPLLFDNFKRYDEDWNQTDIKIAQRTKANRSSTVSICSIETEVTGQHYSKIKADDLVTDKTVNTEEQIEKTKMHLKNLFMLLNPGGTMDIIGTRWDDADAYRWVIDELSHEKYGDERFAIFSVGPYNPDGTVIFQKKFSIASLKVLEGRLGSYQFSCNYLNNPTSPTNRIFQPPMRYWDTFPEEVAHVITVDPAISMKKESSDAVVVDTAESRAGQIFVVEYAAFQGAQKHPSIIIDKIVEYLLRFGANVCGIEAVNYQEVLCTLLADELKKRGLKMEVHPIHQSEDKARRIICLQAPWERGDLLIKRGMAELEEQIEKFRKPIVAKCDILDAIAMRKQVPEDLITFKSHRARVWVHPRYQSDPRTKNPYEGIALPEAEWRKRQAELRKSGGATTRPKWR